MGVLFSGGKDSTYAAFTASRRDALACLITLIPASDASYMFHYPDLKWTALQAQAMSVPQVTRATLGRKEEELKDLADAVLEATDRFHLAGIYTGALASVYQKSRVERICKNVGVDCFSPMWGDDPEVHLRRLVREGFKVMVVGVSALGLDRRWLGRILDDGAVDELVSLGKKYRFHAGLEGGEGETFVLDCPLFKSRVEVDRSETSWSHDSGRYDILAAHLEPKQAAWPGAS